MRGIDYQLRQWGAPEGTAPLRVLLHGFMDVGASFQFIADHWPDTVCALAPDWRGFGGSRVNGVVDAYWFPDYLGDLDALLDALSPDAAVDLIGHSMGGNIALAYAGVRPQRVRRLVNLEGFGLPDLGPEAAPRRLAQWLDELKTPLPLKPYPSLDAVAERLRRTNPRLPAAQAHWLAAQWAAPTADGQWQVRADPAHRRINPMLYRAAEAVAMWAAIAAPVLTVFGRQTEAEQWWHGRYSLAECQTRLAQIADHRLHWLDDAGHMLHHDQPAALAALIDDFLRQGRQDSHPGSG